MHIEINVEHILRRKKGWGKVERDSSKLNAERGIKCIYVSSVAINGTGPLSWILKALTHNNIATLLLFFFFKTPLMNQYHFSILLTEKKIRAYNESKLAS